MAASNEPGPSSLGLRSMMGLLVISSADDGGLVIDWDEDDEGDALVLMKQDGDSGGVELPRRSQ